MDNVNELGYMHAMDQVPYAVMPWCVIFNECRVTDFFTERVGVCCLIGIFSAYVMS